MRKIILFDFDGTIADSFSLFLNILHTVSGKYQLPPLTQSEIEELRNQGAREILKKLQIPFYKLPFIISDVKRLQTAEMSSVKVFPQIPQMLTTLKASGYELGILTSNTKKNVSEFLEQNKMLDLFSSIKADAGLFGKTRLFKKFLKTEAVSAKQILYVGDEIRDIESCKEVTIRIIAVSWGYTKKKGLQNAHPDFIADTPSEIIKIAKKQL